MSIPMDLIRATDALLDGDLGLAERLCRDCLRREPRNVSAMSLLAEIGMRCGRLDDAETLLTVCLGLAPGFQPAHFTYAELLFRKLRYVEALDEIGKALTAEPGRQSYLLLKGVILAQSGRTDEALEIFDAVLERHPGEARIHLNRGRAMQMAGRHAEAVAANRRALELEPGLAEAWWSLSNLKTFRFDDADVTRMQEQLGADDTAVIDQVQLSFALGKALEDRGEYDESFRHYAKGNAAKRRTVRWDADEHHGDVEAVAALFDAPFFAARRDWGDPSPAPIFIVGLPRAGSTLLEQILASHSRVEGTMELPDILSMASRLAGSAAGDRRTSYTNVMATLGANDFAACGAEYLERTAGHRSGAPFFVDKMPNNYIHVGLIHLMLPNAKIVDARRQPMACGFSVFKQLFAFGQTFSYSLDEIGRYYRDYVRLMSHWDEVLPGRVLRVDYEAVVENTEEQVRRLLAYCGLEFESACLDFHRTERVVRTASSEQVRQPIYKGAVEQWRNYEPHLVPLREAIGNSAGH
jgi:tetratricopeptide (TPR) repeat protein